MPVSTPSTRDERTGATDAPDATPPAGRRVSWIAPRTAVVAIVAAAFVVYAGLAWTVDAPRTFSDELLYADVAGALADGEGLTIRGDEYRYAPLYPLLLAPVYWLADRELAYELAKALNALLLALTAVPVFLLARRIFDPWWSVAAAGLGVAVPSAMYVSVVMTESLAYLVFAVALVAIAHALERPVVPRQLLALLAIGVAAATRTQFLALFGAYLVGLCIVAFLTRGRRARLVPFVASPTALALLAGLAAFLVRSGRGDSAPDALGNYGPLWRSYDVTEVLRWLVYHLANLELYLAVVPLAVVPIVVARWYARARDGSDREAAFVSLFLGVNAAMLALAAAFNTTIYAGNRLHDRPLFYVLPLWLIALLAWLRAGAPRPAIATGIGAGLALVLPLLLPFSKYALEDVPLQFNAVQTELWVAIDRWLGEAGLSGLLALVLFTLALVLATLLVPSRVLLAFPGFLLAFFLLVGALSWNGAKEEARAFSAALEDDERSWIDDRVPEGGSATLLTALRPCLTRATQDGFYLSEFFNSAVEGVVHLGSAPDYLPSPRAGLAENGSVLVPGDGQLRADYLVTQAPVRVVGRPVGRAGPGRLVLWRIDGPVRVRGSSSTRELLASVPCR